MSHVLLIVSGGVAAYRVLDVARSLRRNGHSVTPVMTTAAKEFITPLSLEVLCGERVHDALFSPTQESTIDHISLARSADLVLCCPATAHLIARMAQGLADDLATTLLLATCAPIMLAPAMNVRMWEHPVTQKNINFLKENNIRFIGPDKGEMACGEYGDGRLSSVSDIVEAVENFFSPCNLLAGRHILVTAGPTVEPIDPVRFISNHSSGQQGYAIAKALVQYGAQVTLISGPVSLPTPIGLTCIKVQTAQQMKEACFSALPVDVAICVAAVSDWRTKFVQTTKIKKTSDNIPPVLEFTENPDILRELCNEAQPRPSLVIGFAAETNNIIDNARKKREKKGCDWLLANDVSTHTFGSAINQIKFFTQDKMDAWPEMSKKDIAVKLADKISSFFNNQDVK